MKEIEKGIPIPGETRGRQQGVKKYCFEKMDIGDSFTLTYSERMSVYSSLRDYNKTHNSAIQITVKKIGEDQYRCWRVG